MIEIIYNDSGKKGSSVVVKPPKNIRQIGSPRGRHKIYVEDYVYTFLHSAAFEGESQKRAAVLLGKSEVTSDIRYTFISGAVSCEDFVFREDGIIFDECCWEYIYKEIKQYFDGQEIVGWFLGMPGFSLEITPEMEAAHRKYFSGRDKVLLLTEPAEREDTFYAYEQGILQKKEGYYIYYEKNLPMQEYMVCIREQAREREGGIDQRLPQSTWDFFETFSAPVSNLPEKDSKEPVTEPPAESRITEPAEKQEMEAQTQAPKEEDAFKASEETAKEKSPAEQAIQNYRNMLLKKRETTSPKKMSLLLYTAASAAMVVLCVIGITTLNNYEKMKEVEQAISLITNASIEDTQKQEEEPQAQSSGLVVESVPGEVTPQVDENAAGTGTNDQAGEAVPNDGGAEDSQPAAPEGTADTPQQPAADTTQQPAADTTQQPAEDTTQQDVAATAQTYLEQGYYVVQPGDKLELICKSIYQTTAMMDKLCEANQITDVDKIYAGQKLVLP